VINTSHVKVSGLEDVTNGIVSVAGDVELGPQAPTGVFATIVAAGAARKCAA
jgi:hypothetical protein